MKKHHKKEKVVREKGVRAQTYGNRIIVLLQTRTDVTRLMLPSLLGSTLVAADQALSKLKKAGFKIFPINGAGTPLRIAKSQTESEKFIKWRRMFYLDTVKRMVKTEFEIGREYNSLSGKGSELIKQINESSNLES